MCDFENGFKLCLCGEKINFRERPSYHKKKGELVEIKSKKKQPPLQYIWILSKYLGKNKEIEIGRYMMPTSDIGKGLNAEWISLNLNCEDSFDFEYTPKEGDNITFQQNVIYGPYISFIHRNGMWEENHYDPFDENTETIKEGEIKTLHNNTYK